MGVTRYQQIIVPEPLEQVVVGRDYQGIGVVELWELRPYLGQVLLEWDSVVVLGGWPFVILSFGVGCEQKIPEVPSKVGLGKGLGVRLAQRGPDSCFKFVVRSVEEGVDKLLPAYPVLDIVRAHLVVVLDVVVHLLVKPERYDISFAVEEHQGLIELEQEQDLGALQLHPTNQQSPTPSHQLQGLGHNCQQCVLYINMAAYFGKLLLAAGLGFQAFNLLTNEESIGKFNTGLQKGLRKASLYGLDVATTLEGKQQTLRLVVAALLCLSLLMVITKSKLVKILVILGVSINAAIMSNPLTNKSEGVAMLLIQNLGIVGGLFYLMGADCPESGKVVKSPNPQVQSKEKAAPAQAPKKQRKK